MKKLTFILAALLMLAAGGARAQDDAMMKAWMAYMTPGDVHKMMAKDNGTWNAEITMWMAPDAPPTKSTGTTENKMIMGGRYQQSTHKATMMGMPFEGMGIMGYDNAKKIFVSSWIDNFGTGIMNMEGTWDNATKSITLTGKGVDPTTGKDINFREVMKFIDDKNQLFEMYCDNSGKEMKTMEIKYTRK